MSRRNLIFLVAFLILVTIFVFFYLYKNEPEPIVPTPNTDTVNVEQINKELTTNSSSEIKPTKPPEKINKELQASEVIPPGTPSKEEINNSLTE